MAKYDYVIAGAGLAGATCARELTDKGYKCLVVEQRAFIGGNCHDELIGDVYSSCFGGHYYTTNDKFLWDYVNKFTPLIEYRLTAKSNVKGKIYSYPINLSTLHQLWGITTPKEAEEKIEEVRLKIDNPANFEEKALSVIGQELYETFMYGYLKKHWGTEPKNLPLSLWGRIPVRTYYEDVYSTSRYQGVPANGWNSLFDAMLDGIEVKLNEEFQPSNIYDKLIYTGSIDRFYGYCFGELDYRCVNYIYTTEDIGTPMMAYPGMDVPYARKFCYNYSNPYVSHKNVVTAIEYTTGNGGDILAYPINDEKNTKLYEKYKSLNTENVFFSGRLGTYRYWNMDMVIASALNLVKKLT